MYNPWRGYIMLAEIKIEQVLQQSDYVLIDVRSEKEYQEAVSYTHLNDQNPMLSLWNTKRLME